jgi:formylglycine-generating enzyme required for sulfatase activity
MSPGIRAFRTDTAYIPGGTFMMGTTLEEAQMAVDECALYDKNCDISWVADSTPPHPVTIDSFEMESYEVSVEQYALFLNWLGPESHTNGCQGHPCARTTIEEPDSSYITFDGTTYAVRDLEQESDYPVTMVTWWGAQAYCQAIGRRLPTEAEWEHAARGDRNYIYPWGFDFDSGRALTAARTPDGPVQVDSYPLGVSPFGVFHMAGNVSEWVSDWYDASYYARLLENPIVTDNPQGPEGGAEKAYRGGSWDTIPLFVRSVHRMSLAPAEASASVGFRCAADGP